MSGTYYKPLVFKGWKQYYIYAILFLKKLRKYIVQQQKVRSRALFLLSELPFYSCCVVLYSCCVVLYSCCLVLYSCCVFLYSCYTCVVSCCVVLCFNSIVSCCYSCSFLQQIVVQCGKNLMNEFLLVFSFWKLKRVQLILTSHWTFSFGRLISAVDVLTFDYS